MKLPFFIAKRYLLSKKSTNAINIITGISFFVFVIGTAVMVIILSLLNGLEDLVKDTNNAFDPDLKISAVRGKTFEPDSLITIVNAQSGVLAWSAVLEENVVVRYGESQEIARIKGVDDNYPKVSDFDTLVGYGSSILKDEKYNYALFGVDVANRLNISLERSGNQANIIVPKRGAKYSSLNPEQALSNEYIMPGGVMIISDEKDKDLILVPLEFSRKLLDHKTKISSLEVRLNDNNQVREIKESLQNQLKQDYTVTDRYEQNETAYRVFKSEKWMTFALLSFVILIAAFNAVGALLMLVLDKKKDIGILGSIGMDKDGVQKIFLNLGFLISGAGALLGLLLGVLFCIAQKEIGLIRLEGSLVEYFPVSLRMSDLISIAAVVLILGGVAALFPSIKARGIIASE